MKCLGYTIITASTPELRRDEAVSLPSDGASAIVNSRADCTSGHAEIVLDKIAENTIACAPIDNA
jgi:hypothetical protein